MPLIPDLPWTAEDVGDGPGVVMVTHLHLRRFRDVPAFFRDSLAIRSQTMAAPGARSLYLRAQPLARHSPPCPGGTTKRPWSRSSAPTRTARRCAAGAPR